MTAICDGSLLPTRIIKLGNKGLIDELGSLQLPFSGKAAQTRHKNCGRELCRATQSSSSSSQRHLVITGGNTGIGKATATELARLGMSVTIACIFVSNLDVSEGWLKEASRNMEKGEQAVADIIRELNS